MGNDPNNRWPPPPPTSGAPYGAPTPYGQPTYAPPTQPQSQAPVPQYPQPYPQPQPNPYAQQPYAQQPYGQQPYAQPYAPQPIQVVVQNQIQNPYAAPYYAQQPYMLPPNPLKKDTALLLCLLGFFLGINGMQRFYLRETGMGVLYLFTAGLCGIGQIVDAIRIGSMSQVDFDRQYNFPQLPR